MKIYLQLITVIFLTFFSTLTYSNEMDTRKTIKDNVFHLLSTGNFKELDRISKKYRKNKERTSSGLWKLTIFYYGIDRIAGTNNKDEKYWTTLNNMIDAWLEQNPKSPTAHIAKGIVLKGYAWKFRGGSWAKDVPPEAWKPFRENLKLAEKFMLESKSVASKDPHWYEVTAKIKNALNENPKSFKKFVTEGLDKYPDYYQLYFATIDYLAPKWHGDKEKIEEFANQAVLRTKKTEGNGMYARIYWYASQTQYSEKLFSESNVVWKKMKKGISDVLNTYPDSWNIQNFTFFSCLAKDKKNTKKLFDKMSKPMILRAWKKAEYYDYCKSYAYSKGS